MHDIRLHTIRVAATMQFMLRHPRYKSTIDEIFVRVPRMGWTKAIADVLTQVQQRDLQEPIQCRFIDRDGNQDGPVLTFSARELQSAIFALLSDPTETGRSVPDRLSFLSMMLEDANGKKLNVRMEAESQQAIV